MKKYKFKVLDSTNNYMKENINNFIEYDIVIAENQTSGRGRQGNTWLSTEGMALFSFLFLEKDEIEFKDYTKLPLIVGLSVLEALNEIEKQNYKFKWTNDVYLNDKKISGILIERIKNKFIIGIGINVNNKISDEIIDIATSLKEISNKNYNIDLIIYKVIEKFKNNIEKFLLGEWNKILKKINDLNYLHNKEILVKILDNELVEAKALDISEDGKLRVLVNGEEKLYNVGEIIIKKNKK